MSRVDIAVKLCRELAGKPLTTGHMAKATGLTLKQCATSFHHAQDVGRLHMHRTKRGRYVYAFLTAEDCAAFGVEALESMAEASVKDRVAKASAGRYGVVAAKPGKPSSVTLKGKPSDMRGEVKGMDTAPRSYTPAPAPRFAPDAGFRGPFELAGVGRDVVTGKAWGQ